jgi:hypothetical protein
MQRPHKRGGPIVLALAAIGATLGVALPFAGGAAAARGECVVPDVLGVSLAGARQALGASGCAVTIRQLPAHGRFVTPPSPDGRQLVARQSPPAGGHAQAVTVWVKPLCSQSALPGPAHRGAEERSGPAELIAGLYLEGGPLRQSPRCRTARSQAGTVTVSTPAGKRLVRRNVRDGRFAIFPLAPGSYVIEGVLAGQAGARGTAFPRTAFTIAARRTTLLNLVVDVP